MDKIKEYSGLLWFDVDPLTLKESAGFLRLNLLFYAVVQYFFQSNMTDDPFESFFEIFFELSILFIFIGTVLFLDRKQQFYIRATTAILFCTNSLSIIAIPTTVWLTITEDPLSYYVISILLSWLYALIVYIMKYLLKIDLLASSALALFYLIVVYLGAFGLGQLIM